MNREIKFRAWNREEKKMISVRSIDFVCGTINEGVDCLRFDEIELMQFTGLKDVNGKEIYEGDVLEFVSENPDAYKGYVETYVVEWKDRAFIGRWLQGKTEYCWNDGLDRCDESMKVIGNVFENPELLK